MSKRFTDTEIWDKEWFMKLSEKEKLAYLMIKDKCDCVGVWSPNRILAKTYIGGEIDWNTFIEKYNKNFEQLSTGKWFVVDFCHFQYGELTETCPPHKKYISELKRHGLFKRVVEGYSRGSGTPQEKEEEKEKEKEGEKETEGEKEKSAADKKLYAPAVNMKPAEYDELIRRFGSQNVESAIEKLSSYKMSKGKKYKSDYYAILQWVIEAVTGKDNAMAEAEYQGVVIKKQEQADREQRMQNDKIDHKIDRRLSPDETQEFIKSIGKSPGDGA